MGFVEKFPKIKEYANENKTPIIVEDSLAYLQKLIKEEKITKILEIGTAIAYSALHFASVNDGVQVDTIERNSLMEEVAYENVLEYDTFKQVHLHFGDALEYPLEELDNGYDLLFIDAAKAQSQRFFERFLPLLKEDAIIVTDNMDFHNVSIDDPNISKNLRNMLKKIKNYHDWLANHQEFDTTFLNIGDGLAITRRKKCE